MGCARTPRVGRVGSGSEAGGGRGGAGADAVGVPRGNLQERARDARYALAEELAVGDYAAAHTASDQAETVLYRLAVSPAARNVAPARAAGAPAARRNPR